jgi:hypothetical protein
MMKVPNKIPTRLYGRRAMGPSAGGTIWGGAFLPTRGFPATFPAAVPQTEQAEEVPSPENAPPIDAAQSIADSAIVPGIITPPAIEAVNPSLESTTPWEEPVTEAHQPAIPLSEPEGEAVPNFVPATPVPYQPEHINGFKTELNADGTRSISINNSRITIPNLDILASIPD